MKRSSGSWHSARLVRLGRPVVHLGVDVDRVVAAPRRTHVRVPDALQVQRRAARPRPADQQVAAELEVERLERRVGRAVAVLAQPGVGGLAVLRRAAEVERDAPEQRARGRARARRAGSSYDVRPTAVQAFASSQRTGSGPVDGSRSNAVKLVSTATSEHGVAGAAHARSRRAAPRPGRRSRATRTRAANRVPLPVRPVVVDDRVLDVAAVVGLGVDRRAAGQHEVAVAVRPSPRDAAGCRRAPRTRARPVRDAVSRTTSTRSGYETKYSRREGHAAGGERRARHGGGQVQFAAVAR